jgi:hypothetical protein
MWNWIQAFILSIIIIAIGHFIWQFLRDNFTKPIVKPFVMPENEQIQDNHNNSHPHNNLDNEIDNENEIGNDNDMELDNYLKSKINVLNTTDLTELSSHYDTPSSQTTLSQN